MKKAEILKQIEVLRQQLLQEHSISTGKNKINLEDEKKHIEKYVYSKIQKSAIKTTTKLVAYDMGSGTGHKTIAFASQFQHAHGVEPVSIEVEISKLKKKYFNTANVTYHNCGAEKVPLADESIDFVFSETVLEHVNDVYQTLKETHRVMKKGGLFYLACPNYNWIYETHYHIYMPPLVNKKYFKIFSFLGDENKKFIDHINYITPKQLKKDLKKIGFTIKINYSELTIQNTLIKNLQHAIPARFKKFKPIFNILHRLKLSPMIGNLLIKKGFYPSIELLLEKK